MKLSVIFSFRNEELVLDELIRRTQEVLEKNGIDYEIIFVNDASTDKSFEILQTWQFQDSRIKILNMSRRFGVIACFIAGFDHASGDAVIMMDSDLQDPPEIIPLLLAKWQDGADIVHTIRTKRRGESFFRLVVTALGYGLWKLFIPKLIYNSGDFRLLSKRAVQELINLRDPNLFFRGATRNLPFRQEAVAYEREKRYAGKTHFPILGSLTPVKIFMSSILLYSPFLITSYIYKPIQKYLKGPIYHIESKWGLDAITYV